MSTYKSKLLQALTLSRIPLAVVVVILLYIGQYKLAAVVYFAAELTDFFDGYLARKWDITSSFGKGADLMADKFLMLVVVLALCYLRVIPIIMTVIVCVREVIVTMLRGFASRYGNSQFLHTSTWGRYTSTILREALVPVIWFARPNLTPSTSAFNEIGFNVAMTVAWIGVASRICFFVIYLWRDRQIMLFLYRRLTGTKIATK